MPLTRLRDQIRSLSEEFVSSADLTGPRGPANVAAMWCLALLRAFPAIPPPCRCERLLSAALGRPATGVDVLRLVSAECYVPPRIAAVILNVFGGPALRAAERPAEAPATPFT